MCIRDRYLPRPLGGDGGEVEHDNNEIQCGIQIIGVGILLLHQLDAVILHKEAIGLSLIHISGNTGFRGLSGHDIAAAVQRQLTHRQRRGGLSAHAYKYAVAVHHAFLTGDGVP